MRILIFCGSLRKASYNRMLANEAKAHAPSVMSFEEADFSSIPLYDQDIDGDAAPANVVTLRRAVREADGVLFVSPEYNYSIPGGLKNAIDWASRPSSSDPFTGKPVGVMGASMGVYGTVRMQLHIRQVFQFLDARCMQKPEFMLPTAQHKFNADGKLVDEASRKFLAEYMLAFENWVAEHPRRV